MVVGDSGSGKSSLVRAGLAPAFRGSWLARPSNDGPDETVWNVVEVRPGNNPFGRLADGLLPALARSDDGSTRLGQDRETGIRLTKSPFLGEKISASIRIMPWVR
jgi:hypothetical protein